MRQAAATDSPLLAGSGLPLALSGSLLLHVGLLFGIAASAPTSPGMLPPLSVHLVSAEQTVAHGTSQPAAATNIKPHPERARLHRQAHISPAAKPQMAFAQARPLNAAPPKAAAQTRVATTQMASTTSTYYDGTQLDVPPHLLGEIQQLYPARARAANIEGSVTLSLLIDEYGKVDKVSVLDAQPPGYFDNAALDMLRSQRFTPALLHNQPVKSRWRTVVRYRLQS